jgi:hypothetical protein
VGLAAELRVKPSTAIALVLVWLAGLATVALAAPYERPGALPSTGAASNAHRSDGRGGYGSYKGRRPPMRGAGDVRDNDSKQPYYYRYYSDTDRSPGSCRRYANRAIGTKNKNWWTRYRACLEH